MKISYSWLKTYINTELSPEKMSLILTGTGLEVDGLEAVEHIKGGMQGLFIGEVLSCAKHPNADSLSITTVNIGTGDALQIVCGAPNVAAGQKVVVAPVGSTVYPSTGEPFAIKKAKIRGETSEGMICAEDEIGLGASHAGILVLPSEAVVGTPAAQYFGLESDPVFEIGLTPNRIDAASHIGVARDVAAVLNLEICLPKPPSIPTAAPTKSLPIDIQNTLLCPRFSGILIQNVQIAPSPDWLKKHLTAIGLTPINNVVDITNFVMHESGKPIHAFDASTLTKGIIVRPAHENEKITLLDKKDYTLSTSDIVIANGDDSAIALGGIMGGLAHSINAETTSIFIESAYFLPTAIRQTAKRHNLKTDASFRFERGADINATLPSIERATQLVLELCGGAAAASIIDVYPNPVPPPTITLHYAYLQKLLGITIPTQTILDILKKLDFEILSQTNENVSLAPPSYRTDVTAPADVAEELLRIYGYNNVHTTTQISYQAAYPLRTTKTQLQNQLSDTLAAQGYQEIMCNSLTASAYLHLDSDLKNTEITLENPLSEDLNILRPTLLWGGLQTIAHNANRQQKDLKIFEFGNTYHNANDTTTELYTMAMWICGQAEPDSWYNATRKTDFYQLNALLQKIFGTVNLTKLSTETSTNQQFSIGLCYKRGNQTIAEIGKVAPNVLKNFGIKQDVYYAQIYYQKLWEAFDQKKLRYTELPKYPSVRRDLALVINKSVEYTQLAAIAQKTERKLIKNVQVFDVYEGEKIGSDKKQYALSFILQDTEKTLTDAQIESTMNKLMHAFTTELGATIR